MANYRMSEYQGGYNSLDPDKAYSNLFTGYRIKTSELGAPTKPDTANQIQQASQLINQGMVPIEVGALQPEIFSQIPKQHFKEINRLSKLTGAKISLHAPIVEPSGSGEGGWSELQRQSSERILNDAVEKSHDLDPENPVPVTVHSTNIMGSEYVPDKEKGRKMAKLVVVDRETGKPVQMLEQETVHYPDSRVLKPEIIEKFRRGEISEAQLEEMSPKQLYQEVDLEKGVLRTPEGRLRNLNHTQWDDSVSQLVFNKERADEILERSYPLIKPVWEDLQQGKITPNDLTKTQKEVFRHLQNAKIYLDDTKAHSETLFNRAWKATEGDEEGRRALRKISEQYKRDVDDAGRDPEKQSLAINNLLFGLKEKVQPRLLVPMEEFLLDKSSETFANVAFNAYDKFGEKGNVPRLNIENLYSGMAFSSMKDLDNLILESKNKFAEKLVREKGLNPNTARKKADEIIGMTLDVGHLNIAKKQGFTDENLRKEVEQIAKHVKHVHLTDNFGFSDSHLPPGMGNVPFKELMEELEKVGYKGRKIVEAGNFVQHFQESPFKYALEGLGSPMYSGVPPATIGGMPYWNQSLGFQQSYGEGFGRMLPGINYRDFGAGFSQLPSHLGGEMPGGQGSRMSNRPME